MHSNRLPKQHNKYCFVVAIIIVIFFAGTVVLNYDFNYPDVLQLITTNSEVISVIRNSVSTEKFNYPIYQPFKQESSLLLKESEKFKCQSYLTQEIQSCEFPLEETKQVQEFIFKQQNPPNCDEAKLLINVGQWEFGIGSNTFIRSVAFVLAVSEGRVLVQDGEGFWAQRSCENKTYECWLKPITNCSLPKNWRSMNIPQFRPNASDRIMFLPDPLFPIQFFPKKFSFHMNINGWESKPDTWHKAHSIGYMMRPTDAFNENYLVPMMKKLFNETNGTPPLRMMAMFIRQGDKYKDAGIGTLKTPEEFFKTIQPFCDEHNVTHLYLGSDSADAITYALNTYSHRYKIYAIDNSHRLQGPGFDLSTLGSDNVKNRKLADLTFLDTFISQYAYYFAGDLSSNHNRMIDHLRKLNGKAKLPYISVGKFGLITEY